MANTWTLGGSPLGLIGVKSRPDIRTGISTFTGGDSRNINVNDYNRNSNKVSLLTGGTIQRFWQNTNIIGKNVDATGKSQDNFKNITRDSLHNNDVYDTSLINIIEKLSFSTRAALRAQDFAYLKKLGVYPNNRLMIARRFLTPIGDDILTKGGSTPTSVLIDWKKEGEDFLSFNFSEEWEDADADYTNVLNKLGKDFSMQGGGKVGDFLGKGGGALPLPGFTEKFQRDILTHLGILEEGEETESGITIGRSKPLPSGDPNIIKEAKRRKTIDYGESGSGLKGKISVNMEVVYEQKFLSGIDPTIAFMDIFNNILKFGTQESNTYGVSDEFAKNLKSYVEPGGINTLIEHITQAITGIIGKLKNDIKNILTKLNKNPPEENEETNEETNEDPSTLDNIDGVVGDIGQYIKDNIQQTIRKYKYELLGITHALSGLPSGTWHVTLGNPLRPFLSSGDMIISGGVDIKFGEKLAFNDLPSVITASFKLESARNLGLQEIMAKFQTGHLRAINNRTDYTVQGSRLKYHEDENPEEGESQSYKGNDNEKTQNTNDNISQEGNTTTKENG